MDIIRRGVVPGQRKVEWKCKDCESLIAATADEGVLVYDDRDGDAIVFICPVCETQNWVARSRFD